MDDLYEFAEEADINPENPDGEEHGYCPTCSGSGEGRYEGERCHVCEGTGEV